MKVPWSARHWHRSDDELDADSIAEMLHRLRASVANRLNLDLRTVQVDAGIELLRQSLVEMETGEGKTLTTVIPACLLASNGKQVLIATANDYLAQRDATWMWPVYEDLGLSVGYVTSGCDGARRSEAYGAHVTYGTLREFGFDFLRDRLAARRNLPPHCTASQLVNLADQHKLTPTVCKFRFDVLIVDEADSVLIDEARTPLVITSPKQQLDEAMQACFRWCAERASEFTPVKDFVCLADSGAVALTHAGRRRCLQLEMPVEMGSLTTTDILHSLERAIWINDNLLRDIDYLVKEDRVELVDEYTGRASANRALAGGLHQAIEAREGIDLTPQSQPVARISVQEFAMKFKHLCGLTATAWEDRSELAAIYGIDVKRIAPHVSSRRRLESAQACQTKAETWERIAKEVRPLVDLQRAVLIGTRSIRQSEQLSEVLRAHGIKHDVLNARNPKLESETVAQAGRPGQVTVATNMAGRGTDIQLDPRVSAAGGLHVIVSEPHAAARIDRQLIGRSARQGDPGSARLYASLEDEILDQAFTPNRVRELRESLAGEGWQPKRLLAMVRRAQQIVCRHHRQQRQRLTAQETQRSQSLETLGFDRYLDPLPDDA